MTFRAVLFKEDGTGGNAMRVVLERIPAVPGFFWNLSQFRVAGWIVMGRSPGRKFPGIPAPGQDNRRRKKGSANGACRGNGLHLRPRKTRLTIAPNPVISRATPQRRRNRWLVSFRPKPDEIRNVQPEGKFQARTGAR